MKKHHSKEKLIDMRSRALMRWPALSYSALPLVIFVSIFAAALLGYLILSDNLDSSRASTIDRRFASNEVMITGELRKYVNLLRGSTGLLQTGNTDEKDWQNFVDVYELQKYFDGIEAAGVAVGTSPSDARIAYVNPYTKDTRATIGTNAGSNEALRAAFTEAAKTGQPTMTETIPGLFSTKGDVASGRNGFLIVMPYYAHPNLNTTPKKRLQDLRGYSIVLFRGDVLFTSLYKDVDLSHTKLEIYLGEPKTTNLQYRVDNTSDLSQTTVTQKIDAYGKTFSLVYTFDTESIVTAWVNYLPRIMLVTSLVLGALIGTLSGYMLRSRYRRLIYQKERDVNFAKDELLSLASHQLRTPATGVKQYLGMVLQGFAGELNPQQHKYLEQAYVSNNRQLHVINDILHLAKLESGRIVLAERQFDFAAMLREIIDEQMSQAEKGELTLDIDAPSRGLIVGDSHMLRMAVENIVSNAIKYTEPGGRVKVKLAKRGTHWVLTVKDTGVGIADKDLSKLFRQFSRINNPRSEFVTGTGIGLYLAHHLVVLHGGSITVASEEGKGSTFTVRLPKDT